LQEENTMRGLKVLVCGGLVALFAAASPYGAAAAAAQGNNCRMEQQCHWENFKKICVYVKVCR
jgi:Spy/CpxP family protein refolding chaperone